MATKVDEIIETLALSDEKAAGVSQLRNDLKYGDKDLPWETDCFLLSWLQAELSTAGLFDDAVLAALGTDIAGRMPFLKKMLSHDETYQRFVQKASPYLFFTGDNICFGVLEDFARKLGEAFKRAGYKVVFQERTQIPQVYEKRFHGNSYRGIFGLQDPLMAMRVQDGSYLLGEVSAPRYFWSFDHPAGFYDIIHNTPDDLIILTLDKYYVEYSKQFLCRRALFFPPGGEGPSKAWKNFDEFRAAKMNGNTMDISFLGTSGVGLKENIDYTREHNQEIFPLVYNYSRELMEHSDEPSDKAFARALDDLHLNDDRQLSSQDFAKLFYEWAGMEKNASKDVRKRVVKELAKSVIDFHVFGEGWKNLGDFPGFRVHDTIPYQQAKEIYDKSWISLNVMSWHKAGFTERIAEPQLHGSLVVSDSTEYLRENYTDGEDIILFDPTEQGIAELPARIKALLSDKNRLLHIAWNGYQNALKNHTWDARADQFLRMTV